VSIDCGNVVKTGRDRREGACIELWTLRLVDISPTKKQGTVNAFELSKSHIWRTSSFTSFTVWGQAS